MYLLVYGDDTYRSRKKLAAMRERFRQTRDASGLNEARLRASDDGFDRVQEALFSSPFLAERKLVVLEGYLGAPKDLQERIAESLGRKPDSTVVIFYEESSASSFAKSPLFAVLKGSEFTEEFPGLSPAQAERFVAVECQDHGVRMDPRAARTLVSLCGSDTWSLHQETAKVAAYAKAKGMPSVTEAVVHEMVDGERDESVFSFLDACTAGKAGQAMVLLERLMDSGTAELQVAAMLGKQVRTMVGARDLMDRGVADKQAVASALGVHPYPAGKAMAAVRRSSLGSLVSLHDGIVETERLLKTGGTTPKVSSDLFTLRAASSA